MLLGTTSSSCSSRKIASSCSRTEGGTEDGTEEGTEEGAEKGTGKGMEGTTGGGAAAAVPLVLLRSRRRIPIRLVTVSYDTEDVECGGLVGGRGEGGPGGPG